MASPLYQKKAYKSLRMTRDIAALTKFAFDSGRCETRGTEKNKKARKQDTESNALEKQNNELQIQVKHFASMFFELSMAMRKVKEMYKDEILLSLLRSDVTDENDIAKALFLHFDAIGMPVNTEIFQDKLTKGKNSRWCNGLVTEHIIKLLPATPDNKMKKKIKQSAKKLQQFVNNNKKQFWWT